MSLSELLCGLILCLSLNRLRADPRDNTTVRVTTTTTTPATTIRESAEVTGLKLLAIPENDTAFVQRQRYGGMQGQFSFYHFLNAANCGCKSATDQITQQCSTLDECAEWAAMTCDSGTFMFSSGYWGTWGTVCCTSAFDSGGLKNMNWDGVYNTVAVQLIRADRGCKEVAGTSYYNCFSLDWCSFWAATNCASKTFMFSKSYATSWGTHCCSSSMDPGADHYNPNWDGVYRVISSRKGLTQVTSSEAAVAGSSPKWAASVEINV